MSFPGRRFTLPRRCYSRNPHLWIGQRAIEVTPGSLKLIYFGACQSISVAVIAPAPLGRRRSSRPVGYAIGDIGFSFSEIERRKNAIGGSPTGTLNPLGRGNGRGRRDHKACNASLGKGQLHDTPPPCSVSYLGYCAARPCEEKPPRRPLSRIARCSSKKAQRGGQTNILLSPFSAMMSAVWTGCAAPSRKKSARTGGIRAPIQLGQCVCVGEGNPDAAVTVFGMGVLPIGPTVTVAGHSEDRRQGARVREPMRPILRSVRCPRLGCGQG
jgi:hypothetical protein